MPDPGTPEQAPDGEQYDLDPELFKTCFANWVERLRSPAPGVAGVDADGREVIVPGFR